MKLRKLLSFTMVFAIFALIAVSVIPFKESSAAEQNPNRFVYVIPIHQTIESGLKSFLERAVGEAEDAAAGHIIFDINTFGGYVDAATEIGEFIRQTDIPTTAFIHGKAISAGSYISLNADRIVMEPGSMIGAAAVVDGSGNRVTDSKTVSAWVRLMRGAAEQSNRNPLYAEGMVDDQIVVEVPEIGKTFERGQLLSFTAEEALKAGYAEQVASKTSEILDGLQMSGYTVVEVDLSIAEHIARFLTDPVIATLLLLIGIAGVVIELFIPGFGLPGIIGILGFASYFFGNFVAGFAGIEHIFLFVAGIILLLIEIFMPTFGIIGIIGIISLFGGVILSAYSTQQAMVSLGIAVLGAVIIIAIVVKIFKKRGVWNRFILSDQQKNETGYISNTDRSALVGTIGSSLTVLRPSGAALLDGQRVDVVTNGEYIEANRTIKVTAVEGTRVVVGEWKEDNT